MSRRPKVVVTDYITEPASEGPIIARMPTSSSPPPPTTRSFSPSIAMPMSFWSFTTSRSLAGY